MIRKRVLLIATLSASMALAQAAAPPKKEPPALQSTPAVKALFKSAGKRAEEKIVPIVLHRVEASGDARTRLEIQLDVLVLIRWMASIRPVSDDAAASLNLRINQLQSASNALQQQYATPSIEPLNKVQQNGARQLHQLTFDLPATADMTKLDEICRNAGIYLLEISTGQPTNPSQIPQMRPASLPLAPQDAPRPMPTRAGSVAAPNDPTRIIPTLSVSQPLRQQLLATLDMVDHPASNDLTDQDAQQLRTVLKDAIDIAAGLAGNAGVSADDRMALERQLTESLALYGDRRLRDLARERINSMSQYRQVLGSITRLQLSEANYKHLAPAFEYAQKNPASAKQVLAAIEKFVAYCGVYDSAPMTLTYVANPALAKAVDKPYDDSRKGFETARGGFLSAVDALDGGNIAGSSPADLDARLEEMQISLDVIDALQAMPQALDTFSAYKPKPANGLEHRIAKEASIAASPGKGPIRNESVSFLKDLIRVAGTAQYLDKMKIEGGELEIFRAYTSKTPEDLDAKWRANVSDIANQAAGGVPLDQAKIDRNERLLPLVASLSSIVVVEAQLKNVAALDRWVDWGVDSKAVDQVVLPYRSAAAVAFLSFLSDGTDGMKAWPVAQGNRRPIMNMLLRSIGGASQLPELPTPMHTHCAKLMTPLAPATYSTQRFFSLAQVLLMSANLDPDTAAQVRQSLNQSLQQ